VGNPRSFFSHLIDAPDFPCRSIKTSPPAGFQSDVQEAVDSSSGISRVMSWKFIRRDRLAVVVFQDQRAVPLDDLFASAGSSRFPAVEGSNLSQSLTESWPAWVVGERLFTACPCRNRNRET